MLRRTMIVVGLLAIMVGPVASAQQTTRAPGSQAGALAAPMSELHHKAMRLTILNSLPEEARADAAALLDRMQSVKMAEQQLEVATLTAYVSALEAGESPTVARHLATGEVATQAADLTRERQALRTDLEALVKANPDVRGALLEAGPFGSGVGPMFGGGEFGRDAGPMFGGGEFGCDAGPMFGGGEFGHGSGPMFGEGGVDMPGHGMQPTGPQGMRLRQMQEWMMEHGPARNFRTR